MRCRFTGSWFKPHRRHSFAGDDVPQIFVFLGAIAIFGRKKKIFPNFLPDTLGGGVSQPDPPPPPPLQTPPTPPSPPSNTWLPMGLLFAMSELCLVPGAQSSRTLEYPQHAFLF